MDKIVKFINDREIDNAVEYILKNNSNNMSGVVKLLLDTKEAFSSKIEDVIVQLNRKSNAYFKGQVLRVKDDCMNNFKKDEMVVVSEIDKGQIVIDGVAAFSSDIVDKYFSKEIEI